MSKVPPTVSDRLARLNQLKKLKKDAQSQNRQSLYQDNKRQRLQSRKAKEEEGEDKHEKHEKQDKDDAITERERNLKYSIEECEKWDSKVKAKKSSGYHNYTELAHKSYNKEIEEMDVDKEEYERQKVRGESGDKFVSHKPKGSDVDALARGIEDSNARRMRMRRVKKDENDVGSYINEKNKQFNLKLNRQYE